MVLMCMTSNHGSFDWFYSNTVSDLWSSAAVLALLALLITNSLISVKLLVPLFTLACCLPCLAEEPTAKRNLNELVNVHTHTYM